MKGVLERALELIKEDKELHDAIVRYINAKARHEHALARRASRKREVSK